MQPPHATSASPRGRRQAGALSGLALACVLYGAARQPEISASERAGLAARFRFVPFALGQPADAMASKRRERVVRPDLAHQSAWLSAFGAAVALGDVDGDGLQNDACLVDVRDDSVNVLPVPGTPARARSYAAFTLEPSVRRAEVAPMGCLLADLDEDGALDVLVYYWGRPPLAFLRLPQEPALGPQSFERHELVEPGEWYTNALTRADVDGDGHADLVIGNYFPDAAGLLDAHRTTSSEMQDSWSFAQNGGRNRLLLCRPDPARRVSCRDASEAFSLPMARAWTLAIAAADLDDDLLPELYFANDFGPDQLLHNRSEPGHAAFALARGARTLTTPASKVLGHDSFKGMGADFGDVDGDRRFDLFVSNIAAPFALEESHFLFVASGAPSLLRDGRAPFVDRSEPLGLARSSWGWDARLDDFDNDGVLEAVQALGFIRGNVDRWPEVHELALANDALVKRPAVWPRFEPGDDLSGRQTLAFFARGPQGRFVDLADELELRPAGVTRGLATADVDGDGDLDLAVATQWGSSLFYRNDSPPASALVLQVLLCNEPGDVVTALERDAPARRQACWAAVGARALIASDVSSGAQIAQVDGGNGHSGKRSPELHFGLGNWPKSQAVPVDLSWRRSDGSRGRSQLRLTPGSYVVRLSAHAPGAP